MNKLDGMLTGFLEASRLHRVPYEADLPYLELEGFVIHPDVLSPKYDLDSKFFPKAVADIVGSSSLLEIGTGTGVVSVYCQLRNGNKVVATDINPSAVENCRENANKFGVDIDVRYGSVFEPIEKNEKFDFVFWNHPWNPRNETNDLLDLAVYDHNYCVLDNYLTGAKQFCSRRGRVLLGTSELADLEHIKQKAVGCGYESHILDNMKIPAKGENGKYFLVNMMILEFTFQWPP